jgi:tetratricopeptide (TPR) repeat protein
MKGTRAYDLGLYDEAIAQYMAAYKIKDDPALLFNIGQAHRLAGHSAEALRFYKTYLSKLPDAANRAEVEAKMADLSKQLAQQKEAASTPPPAPPPAPPAPAPAPLAPAPGGPALATPPADTSPSSAPANVAPAVTPAPVAVAQAVPSDIAGRGKRVAGIVTAAGGLALVATGIAFGVLAKQAGDDLTRLDEERGVFDPAKEDAGRRDQLLAGVFIGVGAAAVVTGAVLYVLGARGGEPTSQAFVIAPSVAPHAAGAAFRMVY